MRTLPTTLLGCLLTAAIAVPVHAPDDAKSGVPPVPVDSPTTGLPYTEPPAALKPVEAMLSITLPTDAVLTFNGVEAKGDGASRVFKTPVLAKGQPYVYEL